MKNASWLPILFALCALSAGCKKGDKDCGRSINAVQPNTNPAGYEVLIKTNGFSPAAKVVFGSVEATSRAGGESDDIIATVPTGLAGNVEISVEEGSCIARSGGFIVSGSLPSGLQPTLHEIIVPTPVTSPPQQIDNFWTNAATDTSGISIQGPLVSGIFTLDSTSHEFINSIPNIDKNKAVGTINTNSNVIYIEVDRRPNGGTVEHFDGQFIVTPSFLFNVKTSKPYAILLISRESGRQLVLYYPG